MRVLLQQATNHRTIRHLEEMPGLLENKERLNVNSHIHDLDY